MRRPVARLAAGVVATTLAIAVAPSPAGAAPDAAPASSTWSWGSNQFGQLGD